MKVEMYVTFLNFESLLRSKNKVKCCGGVLHMHPSSTLHPPFTIKKIDFKQKRCGQRGMMRGFLVFPNVLLELKGFAFYSRFRKYLGHG
jgi:hypothetical protein